MTLDLANPFGAVGARGPHAAAPGVSAPCTSGQIFPAREWPQGLLALHGLQRPAQANLDCSTAMALMLAAACFYPFSRP